MVADLLFCFAFLVGFSLSLFILAQNKLKDRHCRSGGLACVLLTQKRFSAWLVDSSLPRFILGSLFFCFGCNFPYFLGVISTFSFSFCSSANLQAKWVLSPERFSQHVRTCAFAALLWGQDLDNPLSVTKNFLQRSFLNPLWVSYSVVVFCLVSDRAIKDAMLMFCLSFEASKLATVTSGSQCECLTAYVGGHCRII